MKFGLITIVHIVAAVLSLLTLILTGIVAARSLFNSPSEVDFVIFCSVWSLLVLAYIAVIPLYAQRLYHVLVSLVLLCLTALFWFAGAIAFAVLIGTPDCSAFSTCQTAQAAIAFSFFLWAIFTTLAVLEVLAYMRNRGPGASAGPKP